MDYFYVDPSALSKRYHSEDGSEIVDELFDNLIPNNPKRIFISIWGISETISVLNRKKNEKDIVEGDFRKILSSFLNEVNKFSIESVTDNLVISSFAFILKYNINSADALHMCSLTEIRNIAKNFGNDVILVASDKRLVNACKHEGINVIDPEVFEKDKIKKFFRDNDNLL